MALSASRLSAAIRAAMLADESIGATDGPALTAFCSAIAEAVVEEVTDNAAVQPGTFAVGVDPVTGSGTVI